MISCCLCNKNWDDEEIVMFSVPKNQEKRKKWSEVCDRTLKYSSYICQQHFDEDDLISSYNGKKISLKPNAIPLSQADSTRSSKRLKSSVTQGSLQFINEELFDAKMSAAPADMSFKNENSIVRATKSVQTGIPNTRTCGFIELSMESKVYTLNCFYCTEQFNIWNWTNFTTHMKEEHHDLEDVFVNTDALYDEQDNDNELQDRGGTLDVDAKNVIAEETMDTEEVLVPLLTEIKKELADEENVMEFVSEDLQHTDELKNEAGRPATEIASVDDVENDEDGTESSDGNDEEKEEEDSLQTKEVNQICIGSTNPAIIINFLELLKEQPLLWHKRNGRQRGVLDSALSQIMEKINEKWNLHINLVQMRRSLDLIKKWYRRVSLNKDKRVLSGKDKSKYFKICAELEDVSMQMISPCDLCNRICFDKVELQVHKYKFHRVGELPFKCTRCNYGFASAEKARLHESNHGKSRNFICTVCDQGFFYEKMLKAHMFTHSEDYKPVCELCGKKFPSMGKYRKHKIYHETPKYPCNVCHKSYFQKWTLSEHMKSHNNVRNFVCKHCGKTFIRLKTLLVHRQGIHGIQFESDLDEDDSTETSEIGI